MVYKKDIKLVALDMDGTLLNDQGEVSIANRSMIQEAQDRGIHVVISTGRSMLTCQDYVDSLKLSSYLITVNGSEIWNQKRELIERTPVDTEHVKWMYKLARTHNTHYWASATDTVWRRKMPEDIETHTWLKFGFEIPEDEVRNKILSELRLRDNELEITNSSPINIEINALGVNKARGIAKVCRHLGITMDQVMAVGDSLNDLSMIQAAGVGVAMGNAQNVVKAASNWVTFSNNDDGVAKAIVKWVLN